MKRLLLFMAVFVFGAAAADLSGTWTGQLVAPSGKSPATLVFKNTGTKLTGTVKTSTGESAIEEGSVEGTEVFFTTSVKRGGRDATWIYRGRLFGEEIQFRIEVGDEQFDLIVKKGTT